MTLLDVRNLTAEFVTPDGQVLRAVDDLDFTLQRGEALGIVGESGCGKTTAMLALLRLLPAAGRIVDGTALFDGEDLLSLSTAEYRERRWRDLALIFQGAMNALNPVRTVGSQLAEAMLLHNTLPRDMVDGRVRELLELVGIPGWRASQHPHQFSGGMRQRVMIAMALACNPQLVIADEPTTALDVMVQAQVIELLGRLRQDLNLALIVVTHDLGVVVELCQSVLVMYGGKVAEHGPVNEVFTRPRHPYTQRLLKAFPNIEQRNGELASIPGSPPQLAHLPPGCRFHPRCHMATERCRTESPELRLVGPNHRAACHHSDMLRQNT